MLDIGAMSVFFYCFRQREKILNLIEAASGGRMTPSYFRIGGLMMDLPAGFNAAASSSWIISRRR